MVLGLWSLVFGLWSLVFGLVVFESLVLVFGLWSSTFGTLDSWLFALWLLVLGLISNRGASRRIKHTKQSQLAGAGVFHTVHLPFRQIDT